ncbi:hypothetical protein C0J52_05911 [Blattella germanica]|nr:hypothetical protein C0J52_05911 [Blattella germanica]
MVLWEHSRKYLIRLHHGKQHFSNGKDALLVLAVSKTGRGVEGRRHEKKCAGVAASIEQSPIKSTLKRAVELGIPRTTARSHENKCEGVLLVMSANTRLSGDIFLFLPRNPRGLLKRLIEDELNENVFWRELVFLFMFELFECFGEESLCGVISVTAEPAQGSVTLGFYSVELKRRGLYLLKTTSKSFSCT